jgi:hypothetical protein
LYTLGVPEYDAIIISVLTSSAGLSYTGAFHTTTTNVPAAVGSVWPELTVIWVEILVIPDASSP